VKQTLSTERVRAFRERQRAQKPAKKTPKSGLQRLREFCAKQRALKSGVALNFVLPAAQSIDNANNTTNPSKSNDASMSAEQTSIETSIPYTNFRIYISYSAYNILRTILCVL
jgi:hypothetical protein